MPNLSSISNTNTPKHIFLADMHYMVTASTYRKLAHINTSSKKLFTCDTILKMTHKYGWTIEAWCVLSNHYHFVARSPSNPSTLSQLMRSINSITSRYFNKLDGKPGRKIWWNYWDTCLDDERSYIARLRYVHCNAVKHGIVRDPEEYPFSSYSWFIDKYSEEQKKEILASSIENLHIEF
jgi:putative transposase